MKNTFKKRCAVIGASSMAFAASSHAALPESVSTEIASTQANITEVGGAIVVLAVVAMGFRWLKATFF